MAARDEALMGEHSNPDSVAISIPEDFTKSVPPQVGLVIHPALSTHPLESSGATGCSSALADEHIAHQGSWLHYPDDRELGALMWPAWSGPCCASPCCCIAALPRLPAACCLLGWLA